MHQLRGDWAGVHPTERRFAELGVEDDMIDINTYIIFWLAFWAICIYCWYTQYNK